MEEFREKSSELEKFFIDFEDRIDNIAERSLSYPIGKGLKWIENIQNKDGGFGLKPGDKSNIHITSFALLALSKGGRSLDNDNIKKAIQFLEQNQHEDGWWSYERGNTSESVGITGMIVQAFRNLNMSKINKSFRNAVNFLKTSFSNNSSCWRDNKFSEYGEISVNEAAFSAVKAELNDNQLESFKALFYSKLNADEGYGWKLRAELGDEKSDIENTGIALKILSDLGYSNEEKFLKKAIIYIIDSQLTNFGFPREKLLFKRHETADKDVDFDATSLAISGLIACGHDPYSEIIHSTTQFIANHINEDGGWGDSSGMESDTDSTALAVIALIDASGAAVPLADITKGFADAKGFLSKFIGKNSQKLAGEVLDTKKLNRLLTYYSVILIATLIIVIIVFMSLQGSVL